MYNKKIFITSLFTLLTLWWTFWFYNDYLPSNVYNWIQFRYLQHNQINIIDHKVESIIDRILIKKWFSNLDEKKIINIKIKIFTLLISKINNIIDTDKNINIKKENLLKDLITYSKLKILLYRNKENQLNQSMINIFKLISHPFENTSKKENNQIHNNSNTNIETIDPYSLKKFQNVLDQCKLTYPNSHKVIVTSWQFKDFKTNYFYGDKSTKDLIFILNKKIWTNWKIRLELKQQQHWENSWWWVHNNMIHSLFVKVKLQKLIKADEYTFIQIHSEINPLLRLVVKKNKEWKDNHIWGIIRINSNSTWKRSIWYDLWPVTNNYQTFKVMVGNNFLKIYKDGVLVVEKNISYWKEYKDYFKVGIYDSKDSFPPFNIKLRFNQIEMTSHFVIPTQINNNIQNTQKNDNTLINTKKTTKIKVNNIQEKNTIKNVSKDKIVSDKLSIKKDIKIIKGNWLWVWRPSNHTYIDWKLAWHILYDNPYQQNLLVKFAKQNNIKKVYMFVWTIHWTWRKYFSKGMLYNEQWLYNLIKKLNKNWIAFYALYYLNDDPNNISEYKKTEDLINAIYSFNNKYKNVKIEWIQIDQEITDTSKYNEFIKALSFITQNANNHGLISQIAIKPLWERQILNWKSFVSIIMNNVNEWILMAYSDKINTIKKLGNKIADLWNFDIWINLNDKTANKNETFYDEIKANWNLWFSTQIVDKLNNYYRSYNNHFDWISIHDYSDWFYLQKWSYPIDYNNNIKTNQTSVNNNINTEQVSINNNVNSNIIINTKLLQTLLTSQDNKSDQSFYYTTSKEYKVNIPKKVEIKNIYQKWILELWSNIYVTLKRSEYVETNDLEYGLKRIWDNYYKLLIYKIPNSNLYRIYIIRNKNDISYIVWLNPLENIFSPNNLNYIKNKWAHYLSNKNIIVSTFKNKKLQVWKQFMDIKLYRNMIVKKDNKLFFLQFLSGSKFYIYNKNDKIWLLNALANITINSYIIDNGNYVVIFNYGGVWNYKSPIKSYYIWPKDLYYKFNNTSYKELLDTLSYSFYVISKDPNYNYNVKDLYNLYSVLVNKHSIYSIYLWIINNLHYNIQIENLLNKNISQTDLENKVDSNNQLFEIWNLLTTLKTKSGVCQTFSSLLTLWGVLHNYSSANITWILQWYRHSISKIWNKYYDVTNDISYYKFYKKFKYFWMDINTVKNYMTIIKNNY